MSFSCRERPDLGLLDRGLLLFFFLLFFGTAATGHQSVGPIRR
jgi:hypothetical protein